MQRWNIKLLNELYNKYYKLSIETSDPTLSLEYENVANSVLNIIDRYDELMSRKKLIDRTRERVNFKYVIDDDFYVLDNYGIYCPIIRDFSDFGETLDVKPNTELPTINVSTSSILTVSKDFYDGIGGIFSEQYSKMATNFRDRLHIRRLSPKVVTCGQTYSVYKTDITFVELGVNQTAQDYVSAIHEFGHGISCAINPVAMYDFGKYCFIELESLFFELLGLDYLSDKMSLEKDSFDISMQVLKDYIYSAQLIVSKLDAYNTLDGNQLYNKNIFRSYLINEVGCNKLAVNDVLRTYIRDYFHYIISYLTAIELYLIYQSDNKLALDLLFKIITCEYKYSADYLHYIKSLGLEPGKNIDKYLEILFNKAKDLKDEKSLRYKNQ